MTSGRVTLTISMVKRRFQLPDEAEFQQLNALFNANLFSDWDAPVSAAARIYGILSHVPMTGPGACGPAHVDLIFPDAHYSGILPQRLDLLTSLGWMNDLPALAEETVDSPSVTLKTPAQNRKAN